MSCPLPCPKRAMKDEKVLVVPATCVWDHVAYADKALITQGIDQFATLVARCGSFMERSAAENDPQYKQIIPYAVIRHLDSYFLLQRKSTQSEQRLHNKFSIGVGGHINPSESPLAGDVIRDGLTREINEELHIASGYREGLVGLINDDTTDVGRVHLGVLFEIHSTSSDVSVRETHKMQGAWALMDRLKHSYEWLETWSQIVYDSYLWPRVLRDMHNAATG
jgi:predicted NUDIX family phosphoesterase